MIHDHGVGLPLVRPVGAENMTLIGGRALESEFERQVALVIVVPIFVELVLHRSHKIFAELILFDPSAVEHRSCIS